MLNIAVFLQFLWIQSVTNQVDLVHVSPIINMNYLASEWEEDLIMTKEKIYIVATSVDCIASGLKLL